MKSTLSLLKGIFEIFLIKIVQNVIDVSICRFDAQTGADREVQRILLELLNQMDGFDQTTNVKVCKCFLILIQ